MRKFYPHSNNSQTTRLSFLFVDIVLLYRCLETKINFVMTLFATGIKNNQGSYIKRIKKKQRHTHYNQKNQKKKKKNKEISIKIKKRSSWSNKFLIKSTHLSKFGRT